MGRDVWAWVFVGLALFCEVGFLANTLSGHYADALIWFLAGVVAALVPWLWLRD